MADNIIPNDITTREDAIGWLHRHGYSVEMAKAEADAWEAGYVTEEVVVEEPAEEIVIEEPAEEIVIEATPEPEIIEEDDEEEWVEYDLEAMSKDELEELGREYGIEIDKRKKKATLIEEVEEAIDNWEEDDS